MWSRKYYLTLYGMVQNYPDLFKEITLPERLEKDTMIGMILNYCGDNELKISNLTMLKYQLKVWFNAKYYEFSTLVNSTLFSYNPIENYNMEENGTDNISGEKKGNRGASHNENNVLTGTKTGSEANASTEKTNKTGSEENTETRNLSKDINENNAENITKNITNTIDGTKNTTTNGTVTEEVSAYNSSVYQPSNQTITNSTENIKNDETSNETGTIKTDLTKNINESENGKISYDKASSDEIETNASVAHSSEIHENSSNTSSGNSSENMTENQAEERIHQFTRHGNIGVTTTQQMIEQERNVALFNVYYHIAMEFENYFTIPVY